jgi:hypothetical protein
MLIYTFFHEKKTFISPKIGKILIITLAQGGLGRGGRQPRRVPPAEAAQQQRRLRGRQGDVPPEDALRSLRAEERNRVIFIF